MLKKIDPTTITLAPLKYWESDDRRYPIEWRMQVVGEDTWRIRALVPEQEMRASVRYWEGAVEVIDEQTNEQLGRGYLEMAGYSAEKD